MLAPGKTSSEDAENIHRYAYCIENRFAYNAGMTPQDLLDLYKSQAAIARAAGIKQPSVAEWFALGVVPRTRQYQFEVLTEGRLKAAPPEPAKAA